MRRGSESKPMKQNEAKLADEEVHGYCRNELSQAEKDDPDTHTYLFIGHLDSWSSGAAVPRDIK